MSFTHQLSKNNTIYIITSWIFVRLDQQLFIVRYILFSMSNIYYFTFQFEKKMIKMFTFLQLRYEMFQTNV